MLEKHAQTQAASLLDLQSELKSLKTLMLARRPATSPSPAGNGSQDGGASSTERAANALLQPRPGSALGGAGGRPTIPAWQLAGANSKTASASNGASSQGGSDSEVEKAGAGKNAAQVETVADER